jgi:isovaleryl-CoA dehydrogenase
MSAPFDLFSPTEEHLFLRDTLRRFVADHVEPQALEHDRDEKFNIALFRRLADEVGILGVTVPEEMGGGGMDATAAVICHEELSTSDPGFCLAYLAHTILYVNNVAVNASDTQRDRFLPKALNGEWIGGMGMSEPGAGTDAVGSMSTTATPDGDDFLLNGSKMWITNGCINDTELGDIFLIYAKAPEGVSTFVVEKGFEGLELGQRIKGKTGMRASPTAELVFNNCRVPRSNLIGSPGDSVKHMMRNLEIERLTLAGMGLGIARRSLEVMNAYAQERIAFGQPINRFGQIQTHIAQSYAEYMAARSYVYNVARSMNLNKPGHRIDTDGVKLICATMAKTVADRAMQVLGGYGYVSEYHVERLWRDAKLLEIGGGTLEAHQKNIARDLARLEQLPS